MFISEKSFFTVLFPHLQSLAGNQYINTKLSVVLPQTCLCVHNDMNRAKLMSLICQIGNIAQSDKDSNLMKCVLQDMPLLIKAYSSVTPSSNMYDGLALDSASKHTESFPASYNYFISKV